MEFLYKARKIGKHPTVSLEFELADNETEAAYLLWLEADTSSFWVNLNPTEPGRVIEKELGRTQVGRVMLEADLEMKKTVGKLIHPDSKVGKLFWANFYNNIDPQASKLCFSFRTWI